MGLAYLAYVPELFWQIPLKRHPRAKSTHHKDREDIFPSFFGSMSGMSGRASIGKSKVFGCPTFCLKPPAGGAGMTRLVIIIRPGVLRPCLPVEFGSAYVQRREFVEVMSATTNAPAVLPEPGNQPLKNYAQFRLGATTSVSNAPCMIAEGLLDLGAENRFFP